MPQNLDIRKGISLGILFAFLLNSLGPVPAAQAQDLALPAPGVMVNLSPAFNPPILKGIKVHPDNPFRFDFILDQGDRVIASAAKQSFITQESTKLIKYFLASLTIPEKDLWVNLSPYEKNRIVPESFGQTEMGRDLLAEDYMLKQITASLIYPEGETGKNFWKRVYQEAAQKFGTTNIPVNTFNKIWIIPDKAVVYENAQAGTAYVVESKLKVMLEQDYLALEKNQRQPGDMALAVSPSRLPSDAGLNVKATQRNIANALGSEIIREIVIPELTKEVNEDKNFSQLRQIYSSLILATWYKKKIKDSILEQVYDNKNKIAGVNIDDPQEKEKIYQRYLQAFKKGVFNYIKETETPSGVSEPRKYFSGGTFLGKLPLQETTDEAMVNLDGQNSQYIENVRLDTADAAMLPVIKEISEASNLYQLSNVIAHYSKQQDQDVLKSVALHSDDRWAVFLALGLLQTRGATDEFSEDAVILNDPNFLKKYRQLNRDFDDILVNELGYSSRQAHDWFLRDELKDSIDNRVDLIAVKLVTILNATLEPKNRDILPQLQSKILPQLRKLGYPLTTALKSVDDWLAYSVMGRHDDYRKRAARLGEMTQWPWAAALIFAANGPHTRLLFGEGDWDDVNAQTHLINGFIGDFWKKLNALPAAKYEVRAYAGALLNGLLIQSGWSEDRLVKELDKNITGHVKLAEVVENALAMFPPDKMPSFLHFVDGQYANEVVNDLAYWNTKNHKQVTAQQIFFGLPSVQADRYRKSLEGTQRQWEVGMGMERTGMEKVADSEAKYAWLQNHFLQVRIMEGSLAGQTFTAREYLGGGKNAGIYSTDEPGIVVKILWKNGDLAAEEKQIKSLKPYRGPRYYGRVKLMIMGELRDGLAMEKIPGLSFDRYLSFINPGRGDGISNRLFPALYPPFKITDAHIESLTELRDRLLRENVGFKNLQISDLILTPLGSVRPIDMDVDAGETQATYTKLTAFIRQLDDIRVKQGKKAQRQTNRRALLRKLVGRSGKTNDEAMAGQDKAMSSEWIIIALAIATMVHVAVKSGLIENLKSAIRTKPAKPAQFLEPYQYAKINKRYDADIKYLQNHKTLTDAKLIEWFIAYWGLESIKGGTQENYKELISSRRNALIADLSDVVTDPQAIKLAGIRNKSIFLQDLLADLEEQRPAIAENIRKVVNEAKQSPYSDRAMTIDVKKMLQDPPVLAAYFSSARNKKGLERAQREVLKASMQYLQEDPLQRTKRYRQLLDFFNSEKQDIYPEGNYAPFTQEDIETALLYIFLNIQGSSLGIAPSRTPQRLVPNSDDESYDEGEAFNFLPKLKISRRSAWAALAGLAAGLAAGAGATTLYWTWPTDEEEAQRKTDRKDYITSSRAAVGQEAAQFIKDIPVDPFIRGLPFEFQGPGWTPDKDEMLLAIVSWLKSTEPQNEGKINYILDLMQKGNLNLKIAFRTDDYPAIGENRAKYDLRLDKTGLYLDITLDSGIVSLFKIDHLIGELVSVFSDAFYRLDSKSLIRGPDFSDSVRKKTVLRDEIEKLNYILNSGSLAKQNYPNLYHALSIRISELKKEDTAMIARDGDNAMLTRRSLLTAAAVSSIYMAAMEGLPLHQGEHGELILLSGKYDRQKPDLLVLHGGMENRPVQRLRGVTGVGKTAGYNVFIYKYDYHNPFYESLVADFIDEVKRIKKKENSTKKMTVIAYSYGTVIFRGAVLSQDAQSSHGNLFHGVSLIQIAPVAGGVSRWLPPVIMAKYYPLYWKYRFDINHIRALDPYGEIQKELYSVQADDDFYSVVGPYKNILADPDTVGVAQSTDPIVLANYRRGIGYDRPLVETLKFPGVHHNELIDDANVKDLLGTILLKNKAMITSIGPNGGIDFNADKMNLQLQNAGQAIKFHLDPAQLQALQNAPGFVPVITSIQPMTDLSAFLGISR